MTIYINEIQLNNDSKSKKYYKWDKSSGVIYDISKTASNGGNQLSSDILKNNFTEITSKDIDGNTTKSYVDLEYLIECGDKITNDNKITKNDGKALVDYFKEQYQEELSQKAIQGYNIKKLIDNMPSIFKYNKESEPIKEDCPYREITVKPIIYITENILDTAIIDNANKKAIETAENILKTAGLKKDKDYTIGTSLIEKK